MGNTDNIQPDDAGPLLDPTGGPSGEELLGIADHGLISPDWGPNWDDDPEQGLEEWEGVTSTHDPQLPQYDEPDDD